MKLRKQRLYNHTLTSLPHSLPEPKDLPSLSFTNTCCAQVTGL